MTRLHVRTKAGQVPRLFIHCSLLGFSFFFVFLYPPERKPRPRRWRRRLAPLKVNILQRLAKWNITQCVRKWKWRVLKAPSCVKRRLREADHTQLLSFGMVKGKWNHRKCSLMLPKINKGEELIGINISGREEEIIALKKVPTANLNN